jgi:transposase-like protein
MPRASTFENALQAARLSRVPGVTIAEAAARFDVPLAQVRRARGEVAALTLPELVLASLSQNGLLQTFSTADLSSVARYVDYVNHDGCTEQDVRTLLDELVRLGAIAIEGTQARLLRSWP